MLAKLATEPQADIKISLELFRSELIGRGCCLDNPAASPSTVSFGAFDSGFAVMEVDRDGVDAESLDVHMRASSRPKVVRRLSKPVLLRAVILATRFPRNRTRVRTSATTTRSPLRATISSSRAPSRTFRRRY